MVRFASLLAVGVACALALLAVPAGSRAALPLNRDDPSGEAGRDTCGTTGVGFYRTYRYGTRWFGDFRGAVPGEPHTFCIDLRFWYASHDYRYREHPAAGLRNRDGERVPLEHQERMAYAIWNEGRSADAKRQAAVMLYVHALMGDARPGEVDPAALGPAVAALYARIARAAARLHGPYRVEIELPPALSVGTPATATVRVRSATGVALPHVRLSLVAKGTDGVAPEVTTDGTGVARVAFTPSSSDGFHLSATTEALAATRPRIFAPASGAAAVNGQRLAAAASTRVTADASRAVVSVDTAATPSLLVTHGTSSDRVTITAPAAWHGTVGVLLHGPFRSTSAITCDATPVWRDSFLASGPGTFATPPVTLSQPGIYAYQEVVSGGAGEVGVTTACGAAAELVRVESQPRVRTMVSSQIVQPGSDVFDRVFVEGLAGEDAVVHASLFGPFRARDAITCDGTPTWSGTIPVHGDGEYDTASFKVSAPGIYTYVERIEAGDFVRTAETACGETTETVAVVARPALTTEVSQQDTRPGATVVDTVTVTGLGGVSARVHLELWGPFVTHGTINCTGTPYWTGSFAVRGNGTFTSPPVRLDRAGYFAFHAWIGASALNAGVTSPCGEASETTFARPAPSVATTISDQLVRPGSRIVDSIRVRGLAGATAQIEVQLFGPFPSRAAIDCLRQPYWTGRVDVAADGTVTSPAAEVSRPGFYAYRERLVGLPLGSGATTACALASETTFAAPRIITGRNEVGAYVPAPGVGGATPKRVRIASLGIDAPVLPVAVDVAHGVLGVPLAIRRTGWWRDGAAPGATAGAILVAGHVDSRRGGAGAFFALHRARRGDLIELTTAGGRTFAYRVASVRNYRKSALPTTVYSRSGPVRLVLVTCGGPFDRATRHYRDNVVVTAAPA